MATWPGKDPSFEADGDEVVYTVKSHPPCGKTAISCSAKGPRDRMDRLIKVANNQLKKNMTRHMKTCARCSGS